MNLSELISETAVEQGAKSAIVFEDKTLSGFMWTPNIGDLHGRILFDSQGHFHYTFPAQ